MSNIPTFQLSTGVTKGSPERRRDEVRSARVVLVSACLLGEACRYDGCSARAERVLDAIRGKEIVPICPEAGAGLGVPRPAVELRGGDGAAVLNGSATARVRES